MAATLFGNGVSIQENSIRCETGKFGRGERSNLQDSGRKGQGDNHFEAPIHVQRFHEPA